MAKLSGSGTALRFLGRWQAGCEGDASFVQMKLATLVFPLAADMELGQTNMRCSNRARRFDIRFGI
jgi:hypothetical protein